MEIKNYEWRAGELKAAKESAKNEDLGPSMRRPLFDCSITGRQNKKFGQNPGNVAKAKQMLFPHACFQRPRFGPPRRRLQSLKHLLSMVCEISVTLRTWDLK